MFDVVRDNNKQTLNHQALSFFFLGTFAPDRRASDKPIAIACLRLVTFRPLELRSVPRFFSRITSATLSCAFFEYLAIGNLFYCLPSSRSEWASPPRL